MVWVGLFNDFISWAIFVVKTQVIAEKKPCLALGIYLFFFSLSLCTTCQTLTPNAIFCIAPNWSSTEKEYKEEVQLLNIVTCVFWHALVIVTFPVFLSSVFSTSTTSFLVSDFSRVLNFILAMACSKTTNTAEFQKFLDTKQYCKSGILRYEQIFGIDYVSVGGQTTTAKFCSEHLDHLEEKQKVLDVGCGIGGSAFYMARSIFKTRSNHPVSIYQLKSSYSTNC